jgi:hypothetical protein
MSLTKMFNIGNLSIWTILIHVLSIIGVIDMDITLFDIDLVTVVIAVKFAVSIIWILFQLFLILASFC